MEVRNGGANMTQDTLFDDGPTCSQCGSQDLKPITGVTDRMRCKACGWMVRLNPDGSTSDGINWTHAGRRPTHARCQSCGGPWLTLPDAGGDK
jgi:hypothetical protein